MIRRSVFRPARAGRSWGWLMLGVSTALLGACGVALEREEEVAWGPAPAAGRVLTEHRPLSASSPPSKSVGEDCTTYGRGECLSGLCLHVKPGRAAGYFCSQMCRGNEECPERWHCTRLMPGGTQDGVCQPPPGWVSSVALPSAPILQEKTTQP